MSIGNSEKTDITSQTNAQSGSVYIIRSGRVRQMVFVDVKLPSSDLYLSLPQMASADQPLVSTEWSLRRYDYSLLFIWLRASGTWGQANGQAGATLNGTLTWLV